MFFHQGHFVFITAQQLQANNVLKTEDNTSTFKRQSRTNIRTRFNYSIDLLQFISFVFDALYVSLAGLV